MHVPDLEAVVDQRLKQLPAPRAPHTLLPRILAAVEEWTRRPWYQRDWFTWPVGWRVASIAGLVLLVAGGVLLLQSVLPALERVASFSRASMSGVLEGFAEPAVTTTTAARVVWRAIVEPFVPYAVALVTLMCLACAAVGAALNRVAFGKAFQQ